MFYAVVKGRRPGVYTSWSDCENHIKGYKGAYFKKFQTELDALNFIKNTNSTKKRNNMKQSKLSNFFKITPPPTNKSIVNSVKYKSKSNNKKKTTVFIESAITPDYYVYTDGACSNNGRKNAKAGIGIYFGDNDIRNTSEKVIGRQTNNTAELTAIIKTYNIIKTDLNKGKKVCIASDSQYSIWCATTYGKRMSKDNWRKDIPNKKLVQKIYELYGNNPNVSFRHVRAHTSNTDIHSIGNDHADRLANEAIGLSNCPYQ